MDNYDITAKMGDFELTRLLETRKILGNKLQVLTLEDCALFMDEVEDDFLMSFEEEYTEETQSEDITMPEEIPAASVRFLNIQDVYEKVQSRAGGGSSQRIAMGNITIRAASQGQICSLDVYVQRQPQAAALSGEQSKKVPLQVSYKNHFQNEQTFSVDLDSVYNDLNGDPVYRLATVDIEKRNLFILIVHVVFIGDRKSEPFLSKPFLIRSRKPGYRKKSKSF